jgi:putative long chain acyl-CoA synthase
MAVQEIASQAVIWQKEIPAGHFGLVVGSVSEQEVWSAVAARVCWQSILDALDRIPAVDAAVVCRAQSGEHQLAVMAVALRATARLRMTDLQLGLGSLPAAQRPHLVQVVPEIPLSPTCPPLAHVLRAEGASRPGRGVWCRDDHGVHAPFTSAKARVLGW